MWNVLLQSRIAHHGDEDACTWVQLDLAALKLEACQVILQGFLNLQDNSQQCRVRSSVANWSLDTAAFLPCLTEAAELQSVIYHGWVPNTFDQGHWCESEFNSPV